MEQWEAIIERPLEQGHRSFEKILQTAAAVLNNASTNLASFEIEWVMETLLYEPVQLLSTVASRRGDDVWRKACADALKLLASAVAGGCAEQHYEHIVDLCVLSYDAELRKLALQCLCGVARRSDAATRDVARLLASFEEASQCRAPLAQLVGLLCEHHPAAVSDEVTRIWRGYLNMLENKKNTDTVIKAALEGVCGLFKHFGDELPTSELGHFYQNMTGAYIKLAACQSACFAILRDHSALFRERVSSEPALRALLWGAAPPQTILSVYSVTAQCVDNTTLKNILTTEVFPQTQSPVSQTKLTALRVLAASKTDSFGDLTRLVDVHTLEYELRRERVSRADAELVLWCVEYNLNHSDRLLQAAIMFYDNLPTAVRAEIVSCGILKSPPDVATAATQFLISHASENPDAAVWLELSADAARVAGARLADCLTTAADTLPPHEELPSKLSSLFLLASKMSEPACASLSVCACSLTGVEPRPAVLAAARVVLKEADLEHATRFYKSIRIGCCRDEATLQEACLALVHAPDDVDVDPEDMLTALLIIFSSDVDPSIHGAALKKLDFLLSNDKCIDLDIYDVIRSVEKLQARGDRTDKHIRNLHREITLFLGKHGGVDVNNNNDSYENDIIVDLKKSLALALPYQGTTIKVDLKTILLLAIQHGDSNVLQSLLAVLCANLSTTNDVSTQRCVTLAVRALSSSHATGADHAAVIRHAVTLCRNVACGADLLHYISRTKSCGVRKLLATAMLSVCEDPAALLEGLTLAASDSTAKRAGLDIAETILTSLENNNSLSKSVLPELTVLIAKTYQSNTKATFEIASKAFIDKKELFDKETITETVNSLLENLLKTDLSDDKIYKSTVKMTVEFIKKLYDVKSDEIFDTMSNSVDIKLVYILAVCKSEFGFDNVVSRKIMGKNPEILNFLFEFNLDGIEKDFFVVEAMLKFVEEYCEIMLELKYKETIQLISVIITKFTPLLVKQLRVNIKECFTSLNKQWKGIPKQVTSSFQTWFEKMPIKKITHDIERDNFLNEHKLCVEAMKIMSKVFDIREYILSDVKQYIQRWPTILLKLYSSGRLTDYYMNETSYFTDILTVSSKLLTSGNLKNILKGSELLVKQKNMGILFCGFFVEGFFDVLTEKPFVLLDEDLKECSVLLNDIVRLVAKKTSLRDRCGDVLQLVDKLWPTYERHSTFNQKHSLLTTVACLPVGLGRDSNPLRWLTSVVCSRDAVDDRIKLLGLVPEETLKSPELTSAISSVFPARLRELRPPLLDAVAAAPGALLRVVCALADDPTAGWWDAALESCMVDVARRNSVEICEELYKRCHSERVCERMLVPLLRHSSTEVCEKFLATVLSRVLANLNKRPKVEVPAACLKTWNEYMISLHLLLIAFEKLPTWSLESPSSALYSSLQVTAAPWQLVRSACRLVDALRGTTPPTEDELRAMYRKLQCMLYNTLSAGICRRRPAAPLYRQLFSVPAFEKIADEEMEYVLPVRASWSQRNKSLPVAVPLEPCASLPSLSRTQRSRIFLRTLSENPMLFDLHSVEEEVVMETQDISVRETPLNGHPCAGTLTALFRHVAASSPALTCLWAAVVEALGGSHRNVKWLLAQIICNCKEELKPLASELVPGLLGVLSSTVDADTKCMNGLHLDVLDTILYWRADTTSADLSIVAHHLITTCMELRRRNVFDGLLRTLNGYLELYGSCVQIEWKSFENYYEDQRPDTQKSLLQVIKTISKNKLYAPRTLSKVLSKLDTEPSKVSECFGLAMTSCRDEGERQEALGMFRKYLEKCNVVTVYVRVLYYACLGCEECCGEKEFRKIMDYVTKVTSHDRTKCLHVLSAYLSRGRRQHVADMFDLIDLSDMIAKDHNALELVKAGLSAMDEALRRRCISQVSALTPTTPKAKKLVVEVMMKAFEELFHKPTHTSAKRQKTDTTTILSVSRDDVYSSCILTCLGAAAVDADDDVAKMARGALGAKLDKELGARFAECFLLTIYLPAHTDKPLDLSLCASALLEMLYSDVRNTEIFRNCKLRDEPLAVREEDGPSKLLTLSKTFQGTFRSYSSTRRRTRQQPDANKPAIDVQVPIDSILETLLDFAKTTPEAAQVLLTESLRSILSTTKFDMPTTLVPLLGRLLVRAPAALSPLYLHMCRALVAAGNAEGLLQPIERLRSQTTGTEGADLVQLVYEEVRMRCEGEGIFQLGRPDTEDVVMEEITTFTIQDLKSAFGKLSDWNSLTLQQRRAASSALPPLWTSRTDFVTHLNSYEVPKDTDCWFDKMASSYKQEMGPNSVRWLRTMARWPRRHFEMSAITEATSWRHDASEAMTSQLFRSSECLAEWAARLMIRSAYYNSLQHSEADGDRAIRLSRSHELEWCARANEMGIPSVALQCIDRNVEELCDTETLAWLRQKLLSLRQQARERHDDTLLRHARHKAELYTPQYATGAAESIEMYHLMLLLDKDMKSLSYHGLQTILTQVDRSARQVDWKTSSKQAVSSVYQLAMEYYEESIETGVMDPESCLSNMCLVFCRAADVGCPPADALLAVLLASLDKCELTLGGETAERLLEKLSPLAPSFDPFTVELLEKNSHKFPAHLQRSFSILPKNAAADKYRRCLQLVCDPGHLLVHYCEELVQALRAQDAARWKATFNKMKDKIYDNPYAGPSFKLLDKYKGDLYEMYKFELTPEYSSKAESKLKSIIIRLSKEPQASLHLADLCPALLRSTEGTGVEKWFGLSRVTIVKFYDKVQVFTDSIRRPVVLSMLLSDGTTRRAIQKTGEPLAGDAAAQRVAHTVRRLAGDRGRHYTVTLLDDESAVIQYLEDHERLRTLLGSVCDLEVLQSVGRPSDQHLLDSPAAALLAHRELCDKVPPHALRTALELSSSSVQDFVSKKRNFTDSLADMTLLTWLLGLGDRHLQNILCSSRGHVCGVDWGHVWRRGCEPPARLTRNLLAVTDVNVLEARLQRALQSLRDSAVLLEADIRVAFRWMGAELQEQLQHVRGILRGVTSSYHVTRDVIASSRLRHKEKYTDLLDNVLGEYRGREEYSVEDQISCLLRQCTAPELLSVTRSGWEPWL